MAGNYTNLKGVLWLSICFFVLMWGYFSAISVYSKVMKDNGYDNMGFYSAAIIYSTFALGCLVAPAIANTFKIQRVF